ncbi:MAG: hypothetical protein QXF22_02825 [Thermoplasmata archaeon]
MKIEFQFPIIGLRLGRLNIYTTMKTYSFVRTEIQRKIVENALNEEAAQ